MREKSLAVVEQANKIIAEYEEDGYDLTLRQLYYQFVSRDLIANKVEEYKRLGDIVSKARRCGLIDWDAIVDRTRNLRRHASWDSPQDIVDACAGQFKLDPWRRQDWRVEVWFEKDALLGVFERACEEYRIPYFSCRGYTSDSEVHAAARRLRESRKDVLVLHFGDHDPSGIDMSRDIESRLQLFRCSSRVEVRRIALTMDQVEEHQPPPNPAKETDSRFAAYREQYGDESWELDALDPRTLSELVEREVREVVDPDLWQEDMNREREAKEGLRAVAKNLPALTKRAMALDGVETVLTIDPTSPTIESAILPCKGGACISLAYVSGDDLLVRDVSIDCGVPMISKPGRRDMWRFNDIADLEHDLGEQVWRDLAAYRRGEAWRTADVLMALLDAADRAGGS